MRARHKTSSSVPMYLSRLMMGAAVTLLATPALVRAQTATQPKDPQVVEGLARLRAATEPFKAVSAAAAAGYARDVAACLVHEHHGAMGYHHNNPALADAKVEIERPEILLYERLADSSYRLNGVEYIVPYRAWPRDSVAPTVMGQKLKHEDNLKIWYLHAWAWTPNSEGVFADFHPDVKCSPSASKVFKPSGG
jgi:hypothetical protein